MLKIAVINAGSPQPILRTIALARFCTISTFIEVGPETANHALLREAGIAVDFVPQRSHFGLPHLVARLKQESADAYVCHYAAGSHVYATLLARRRPLALVAMGNDILYDAGDRTIPRFEARTIRIAARQADFISCKSVFLTRRLQEWGVQCPLDVNYWGVDHSVFSPGDRMAARRSLGLPLDARVALSMRAFEPRCNIHLVARAFLEVAQEFPDLHLVFVGAPTFPRYAGKIREIIGASGLSSRSHFSLSVGVKEMVSYYRAADVAVSVGSAEGFPNSVLEMLACKTPVIVGRIPQIEELLTDGENARFCDLTESSIANGMRWMLDPGNRRTMEQIGDAGLAVSRESADIVANARRFASRLEELERPARGNAPAQLMGALALGFMGRMFARRGHDR